MTQIQNEIETRLKASLNPIYLAVINDSDSHHVAPSSETHFTVIVAAEQFNQQSLVERHRSIYRLLADRMQNPIHALSLHCYSPCEWPPDSIPRPPACRGGKAREQSKKLP